MAAPNRVAELREAQGWTREELAAAANVTYAYIYKLETGKSTRPNDESLSRIAAALSVTTDQLMGRSPLPGPLAALQAEGVPDARLHEIQDMWDDLTDAERELAVAMLRSMWRLRHPLRKQRPQGAPGDA